LLLRLPRTLAVGETRAVAVVLAAGISDSSISEEGAALLDFVNDGEADVDLEGDGEGGNSAPAHPFASRAVPSQKANANPGVSTG
jgi:hypothetical protein